MGRSPIGSYRKNFFIEFSKLDGKMKVRHDETGPATCGAALRREIPKGRPLVATMRVDVRADANSLIF